MDADAPATGGDKSSYLPMTTACKHYTRNNKIY